MRSMRTYSRRVYWNTLAFGIALLVGSVALLVVLVWLTDTVPGHLHTVAGLLDAIMFFFDQNGLQPALEATQVSVPRSAIASMISSGIA